jgi:hypothetical protein
MTIIARYKASPEFNGLAPTTRRSYLAYIKLIEDEFGDLPVAALADRRVRGEFKDWRDGFGNTPRKADFAQTVLVRVLSFAKDRGHRDQSVRARGPALLWESPRQDLVGGRHRLFAVHRA